MTNIKFQFIVIFALLVGFTACKKEEIQPVEPTNPTTTTPVDTNNTTGTAQSANIDQVLFKQLKQAGDLYDKNEIWEGYDFSKRNQYFVFKDANDKAIRGYLINPHKEIAGATKVVSDNSEGLNVYRYDALAEKAKAELATGNGAYTFDFKIEGTDYYTQSYTEKEVKDIENGSLVLATHEVFHMFQFDKWKAFGAQDEENYPLTKELLALQILETKIAEKFPMEQNKTEIKKYLEMYVAIRSKEIDIDPSKDKLVKNMANAQETFEGTARYVEFMAAKEVLTDFNPKFYQENTNYLQSKRDVRETFAFGIWYGTGAALAYMVDESSETIESECIKGVSLYDQAAKIVNLSAAQKANKLAAAKAEFGWTEIQTEAARLVALK